MKILLTNFIFVNRSTSIWSDSTRASAQLWCPSKTNTWPGRTTPGYCSGSAQRPCTDLFPPSVSSNHYKSLVQPENRWGQRVLTAKSAILVDSGSALSTGSCRWITMANLIGFHSWLGLVAMAPSVINKEWTWLWKTAPGYCFGFVQRPCMD